MASDSDSGVEPIVRTRPSGAKASQKLASAAASIWPTATAQDGESTASQPDYGDGTRHKGTTLTEAIRDWATPLAADSRGAAGAGKEELPNQAQNWATPRAEDGESAGERVSRGVADTLTAQARNTTWDRNEYPTTTSRDMKGRDLDSRHGGASLAHAIETGEYSHSTRLDPTASSGPASSPECPTLRRRLNPAFVCWLMGWTWWWTHADVTNSEQLETEWSRWQQQSRSMFSLLRADCRAAA